MWSMVATYSYEIGFHQMKTNGNNVKLQWNFIWILFRIHLDTLDENASARIASCLVFQLVPNCTVEGVVK